MSVRGDGEWVLVHRCVGCDEIHLNRTAGDDNPLMLMRVAVRALGPTTFPARAAHEAVIRGFDPDLVRSASRKDGAGT